MPDMTATLSDKFTRNKPKLLDQVRDVIRLKHFSIRTEQSYIHWIRRFILFHHRSEEHTSELQSLRHLVCRLLLEKKKKKIRLKNNHTKIIIDVTETKLQIK